MFWHTLNWDRVAQQLGGAVKVFDVACGAGQYGKKYQEYLGKNFAGYTGIDIYKHGEFPAEFTHILDKAENIQQHITDHNLIVSQSGLEHIEGDVDLLINALIAQKAQRKKFLQIHLVPAPSSLFLYLWHGWRQYSKNNLAHISERLTDFEGVGTIAIPLGGWNSFWVHFFEITVPTVVAGLLRKSPIYTWDIIGSSVASKTALAALKDRFSTDKIPTFWAFIVYSDDVEVDCLFS